MCSLTGAPEGAITEFDSEENPIFHAFVDSGSLGEHAENYRAFKFNWTGTPHESIAVASYVTDGGSNIYVSWNGDTRTEEWEVFGVDSTVTKIRCLRQEKWI